MKLVFLVLALLSQRPTLSLSQQADGEVKSGSTRPTCKLSRTNKTSNVTFDKSEFKCINCKSHQTLLYLTRTWNSRLKTWKDACQLGCHGVLCSEICLWRDGKTYSVNKLTCSSRKSGPLHPTDESPGKKGASTIPLVIGFTIGGILLAIVVAGIFATRHHRAEDRDGSDAATTPVSLSNTEWNSNGASGSSRRRKENLRVQEASAEDLTAVTFDESHEQGIAYRKDENGNNCLTKAVDDASSVGHDSYRTSEITPYAVTPYYSLQPFEPSRSNRSSDIVLEDDYVARPNFVDRQFRNTSDQNRASSEKLGTEDQNFFNGQTSGSMTHDAICMSLTHSANNRGDVEYVIQDEDLAALDASYSVENHRTPRINGGAGDSQVSDDDTVQISSQPNDIDFERASRRHSAKSDKSGVAFSENRSQDGSREQSLAVQHENNTGPAPHSSGIEEHCLDGTRTSNGGAYSRDFPSNSTSWNQNSKGELSERVLNNTPEKHNRFIAKGTNRSKSCTWKSPNAPSHSRRKQSGKIHCPFSAPTHATPRPSNLTHVFVDVHRNMVGSDEDLLSQTPAKEHCNRNASFSDSDSSSCGEIPLSALQRTPDLVPYDVQFQYPPPKSPDAMLAAKRRNKSMYALRNGHANKRTAGWAPRTVRLSSGGSGEYAIPFGSLVP